MTSLKATREAMAKAEGFVLQMKQAKNLRQFKDAWKDYLGALQRTWNKLGSEAKNIARVHAGTPAAAPRIMKCMTVLSTTTTGTTRPKSKGRARP